MSESVEPGGSAPSASRHVSSFHLAALRLGAAQDPERERIEGHLARCARCRGAADTWQASLQEFQQGALPRTRGAVRARANVSSPVRRRRWTFGSLGVLAAAAAAALFVWRAPARVPVADHARAEPAFGVKGGPDFVVAVRRGDRIFHADGEPVRTGDQIRFVLDGVRAPYLMIGSVDGAGRASIYVPYEGAESAPVVPGQLDPQHVEIDGSIVLDATPGPERVFALLSQRPIAAGPVRDALSTIGAAGAGAIRDAEALSLPPQVLAAAGALMQRTVLLEKGRE